MIGIYGGIIGLPAAPEPARAPSRHRAPQASGCSIVYYDSSTPPTPLSRCRFDRTELKECIKQFIRANWARFDAPV